MNYFKALYFKAKYFAAKYLAGTAGAPPPATTSAHFRHFFSTMGLMGAFIDLGSGGGPSPPYVAKAVQSSISALQQFGTSLANTQVLSGSIWINYDQDYLNYGGLTFITCNHLHGFGNEIGFEAFNYQSAATDVAVNVVDADGATELLAAKSAPGTITYDTWYNYLWSLDSLNGVLNMYIGDTNVFSSYAVTPTFPLTISISGTDINLGSTNGQNQGLIRFADCWISTTQFVDWSNPTMRAKVHNNLGKPVDLGDGSLLTGTKPEIFFSGDKDGFPTNKGTGGAFKLVNTLYATGNNGPGSISLSGAVAGQTVFLCVNGAMGSDVSSDFEGVISVNDQIQQTGMADHSGDSIVFSLSGALTNASTSPSD